MFHNKPFHPFLGAGRGHAVTESNLHPVPEAFHIWSRTHFVLTTRCSRRLRRLQLALASCRGPRGHGRRAGPLSPVLSFPKVAYLRYTTEARGRRTQVAGQDINVLCIQAQSYVLRILCKASSHSVHASEETYNGCWVEDWRPCRHLVLVGRCLWEGAYRISAAGPLG